MLDVVAGVLVRDGRVLAARRSTDPVGWEFAGGKVEPGETPEQALVRELREELGIEARVGAELPGPVDGCFPINERYRLRAFWVESDDEPAPGVAHGELRWLGPDELAGVDWLPADVAVVEALRAVLGRTASGLAGHCPADGCTAAGRRRAVDFAPASPGGSVAGRQ